MSAGFTPGPWAAFHRAQGVGITGDVAADFVIPADLSPDERDCVADYAVARCLTSLKGFDPVAERKANANLIAASPELYEALEQLLRSLSPAEQYAERLPIVGKAEMALAKARGEQ